MQPLGGSVTMEDQWERFLLSFPMLSFSSHTPGLERHCQRKIVHCFVFAPGRFVH